jgi:hypothetical protein
MSWLTRKFDSLGGALFGGVAGAAASQFDAFVLQYLQRLGGHLDEAQRQYTMVLDTERYRDMAGEARAILLADARSRVEELSIAAHSIADADILHRPFAFLAHMDTEIAARTFETFRPVLPVDVAGLVYAGVGVVLGLIVYELLKAPFAVAMRRRTSRPPAHRGGSGADSRSRSR